MSLVLIQLNAPTKVCICQVHVMSHILNIFLLGLQLHETFFCIVYPTRLSTMRSLIYALRFLLWQSCSSKRCISECWAEVIFKLYFEKRPLICRRKLCRKYPFWVMVSWRLLMEVFDLTSFERGAFTTSLLLTVAEIRSINRRLNIFQKMK